MRVFAAAAVALAIALPGAAAAQPISEATGPDSYLHVHLGAFVPQADLADLDTGYTFGAAFGARFTRHLAVEAGLALQGAREGTAGLRYTDVPISVSLVARLPFKQAELAGYGGADLHLARLSSTGGGSTGTEVGFGGHVGARVGFNLWPTILFGLDVRLSRASAHFDGVAVDLQDVRCAVTLQHRFN